MKAHLLQNLNPKWLPLEKGARWRTGIKFLCPECEIGHYLVMWFANPMDSGKPEPSKSLVWISGTSFADLTMAQTGVVLGGPVHFDPLHPPVWVVDGECYFQAPAPLEVGSA